jgi:peptidoglycan hydrolase CwlO-like protein
MLQLETLMLFGLGFAVAALIALFVARALWLYALRLGRLRSLRQAPATHADLRTEINRLRAENAMTAVRLERKAEALSTRNAELIARTTRDRDRLDLLAAEVDRHRSRGPDRALEERAQAELAALEAEARQTIEALETEIAERDRMIAELRQSLGAREDEIAALRLSADRFAEDVAARDRRLVELEQGFAPSASAALTQSAAPQEAQASAGAVAVPASERLRMRIEELGELSRQIEAQREALKAEQASLEQPAGTPPPEDTAAATAIAADGEPAPAVAPKPSRRALKPSQRQAGIEALATRLKTIRREGPSS